MLRLAVLIALTALTLIGSPLVAAAGPSLNWGSHVNPARCPTEQGYRYLEINVTRKVEGDFAFTYEQMGPGGPLVPVPPTQPPTHWAVREFNQHIQVWQIGVQEPPPTVGTERFCALVRYQGSFTTRAPLSSTELNSPAGLHRYPWRYRRVLRRRVSAGLQCRRAPLSGLLDPGPHRNVRRFPRSLRLAPALLHECWPGRPAVVGLGPPRRPQWRVGQLDRRQRGRHRRLSHNGRETIDHRARTPDGGRWSRGIRPGASSESSRLIPLDRRRGESRHRFAERSDPTPPSSWECAAWT